MLIKRTKSKTYLLPLLAQVLPLESKFIPFIINTYLYKEGFSKDDNYLHILHRFCFKNPEFTKYEHALINSEYYVESVDVGEDVLYTFKFPEEFEFEYNAFIYGLYSEFKEDAKKDILKYLTSCYSSNPKATAFLVRTRRVLYKDERLRQEWFAKGVEIPEGAELESSINIEDETFKFKTTNKNELENVSEVSE